MDSLSKIAALNTIAKPGVKAPTISTAAPTPARSEVDLAKWHAWKRDPSDKNLSGLLQQVNPLIQREVNKWSGTFARPLLTAEGQRLAIKAFDTYSPDKGTALGTHVVNNLLKMSRLTYANQNVARLPETKMTRFHSLKVAEAELLDELGRPPTISELADHLGWSLQYLTNFQTELSHKEILESGGINADVEGRGGTPTEIDQQDHVLDYIYHDLTPQQKIIFEHTTGYRGAPILQNNEIIKKSGLTQGQYSYQKRLLIEKVQDVMNRR